MQIKLFSLRLTEASIPQDQDAINRFMDTVSVKKTASQYVPGEPDYWSILMYYESPSKAKEKQGNGTVQITEADLTEDQQQILTALRTWRKDKAHEAQIAEFMILHNATLVALAQAKPNTMEDLNDIKGMGQQKIARYGDDVMAIMNAF